MQGIITSRENTGQTAEEIKAEYNKFYYADGDKKPQWQLKLDGIIEQLNDINKQVRDINRTFKQFK